MVHPVTIMANCTVRITGFANGVALSVGTGFLYAFTNGAEPIAGEETKLLPTVITNKHVVDGCDTADFLVSVAPIGSAKDQFGQAVGKSTRNYSLSLEEWKIDHPSATVDLCAMMIAPLLNAIRSEGLEIQHAFLGKHLQLPMSAYSFTRAIEPIAMVGYPKGIWDSVNNLPLIRRGSTATHALIKYEGRTEFLIDAACFSGSSGSPVFLFEDGMYRSSESAYSPGTRIALLGVLYAGPQFTAQGTLELRPIPHNLVSTPVTSIPMNLGFVIQAQEIDVIGDLIQALIRPTPSMSA